MARNRRRNQATQVSDGDARPLGAAPDRAEADEGLRADYHQQEHAKGPF